MEMAAAVRKAPYKDFLQPALHRRFTSTATVLLAVSYVEAVLLDSWSSCSSPSRISSTRLANVAL